MFKKLKRKIALYFIKSYSGYELCYLSLEAHALSGEIDWDKFDEHLNSLKYCMGEDAFNKMILNLR